MSTEFAGSLRERISIDQPAARRDALGAGQGQWTSDGSTWARISPVAPADMAQGDALTALPRWSVMLRARAGLRPGSRLLWRGRYLAVRAISQDPQSPDRMILMCEEMR